MLPMSLCKRNNSSTTREEDSDCDFDDEDFIMEPSLASIKKLEEVSNVIESTKEDDDMLRVVEGNYRPDEIHLTENVAEDQRTTVMIRNLPNKYTQNSLIELFEQDGNFLNGVNFLYLPIDFRSKSNIGYAFINFDDPKEARRFMNHFINFSSWKFNSSKKAEVIWSLPCQGLAGHIDRYRNSPVMHPSVPEDFKPSIFLKGEKMKFPEPKNSLEAPKLRRCKKNKNKKSSK
jgi:RNA recognition motif-containing protein